jgi:DNA-binding transcriptional regulator YiaG
MMLSGADPSHPERPGRDRRARDHRARPPAPGASSGGDEPAVDNAIGEDESVAEPRMSAVARWSGREVRALREARRMSIREFAAHLGVSDRMVSKWEAGGAAIRPRPVNQAALDTSLARSGAEVRARFAARVDRQAVRLPGKRSAAAIGSAAKHVLVHPVDGKLMTMVDSGPYLGGYSNERLWLTAYYIDVYPTTNSDYLRFVEASGHRPPSHWPGGACPEHLLNHPVVMVSYRDAMAYATWAAKALPSSQQWEKAARGIGGATYPWGDNATPAMCNVRRSGVGGTTPVDWYDTGVSPWGAFDMCGNVWEWCDSHSQSERRELKGGSFTSSLDRAAPAAFNDAPVDMVCDDIGFRCAVYAGELLDLLAI